MPYENTATRCTPPEGLVKPVPIDPDGVSGPTPGQARGPGWRRTSRGLYVPAGTPDCVEQRIIEAAARLPDGGAVTGWAACRMHGAAYHDGLMPDGRTERPVPLAVGRAVKLRAVAGVELYHASPGPVLEVGGVRCVTPERAAYDAAAAAPDLREAVVALDMAVAGLTTTPTRLRAHLSARRRSSAQVRAALDLVAERVDSPQETRLRLVWLLDAGLGAPLVNHEVHDEGGLVGVPDLLDEEAGLIAEYDGAEHRTRDRHAYDTRREESLRRLGLELVRIVGPDLADRTRVAERLCAARSRARFQPVPERRWRVVAPASTEELVALRELRRQQHEATLMAMLGG